MSTDQQRRVAVVTGGSQGLGFALAEVLAGRGWDLVIDARREDRLDFAAGVLRRRSAPHASVVAVAGDVADPRHREQLADAARRIGPVALVVNNASTLGASPLPSMSDISASVLERIFAVNVIAPLALVRVLDAQLVAGATIVNVTSDAAVEAYDGWGGYGASKAALEHAGRVLGIERPDLRILAVDPGDMRTEMHQEAFPGDDISDRPLPAASVPGLLALIEGDEPSGRYRVTVETGEPLEATPR